MPLTNLCSRLVVNEYPLEHPILKLQALTFPTAMTSRALPLELSPELPLTVTHSDAE
jgi:hypothetical protein